MSTLVKVFVLKQHCACKLLEHDLPGKTGHDYLVMIIFTLLAQKRPAAGYGAY
jgi:hypothetical protein